MGSTAYLLPPSAYVSEDWFAREQARLLGPGWALVASVDELGTPGDYLTATVGDAPLLVVNDGGTLRAHHNVCRHRGMRMLTGCGQARTFNCFYHQWRYALDGALVAVPQRKEQFPDLDPGDWGLLPASVAVWEGMVFAHPGVDPPALSMSFGDLPGHLGSYRPGDLRQVGHARLEANCNWKLFVENHIDVYHLWYLHSETLGDFDHTQFEHDQVGPHWTSYEPLRGSAEGRLTAGTVPIGHLSDRDRLGIGAHLVFPNLMIATSASFFATYVAEPVAPDRTIIDLRVRAEELSDGLAVMAAVQSFITEDITACEEIQAAIKSPAFAVGPLAEEHERPIMTFHQNVLAAVG